MTLNVENITTVKSPFQLFSSYKEEDKDKFFGREEETRLLYQYAQESNVILVYGKSGTGKTSLVQCGLLNRTKHFSWATFTIRRSDNITHNFRAELKKSLVETEANDSVSTKDLIEEVYLKSFQPILFVFDQFEEVFVFGDEAERNELIDTIEQIQTLRIPWKMIFVIRADFLSEVDFFEKKMPNFFKKRQLIELMDKSNCRRVVIKSFQFFEIDIPPLRKNKDDETDFTYSKSDKDIVDIIVDTAADANGEIHLPYFQMFLDKLWKEAYATNPASIKIDEILVDKVGNMGNVLKGFLHDKVADQQFVSKIDAWRFLKLFVPPRGEGTTRKKVDPGTYTSIPSAELENLINYFDEYKILSGCSGEKYELAHESLVPVIHDINLHEIRPRLSNPEIEGNPYKGLASFNQIDNDRFYGRKDAVTALYDKINAQNFIVVVGNSGSGKSSLIKAGLFPKLEKDGYKILSPVRAGENPLKAINDLIDKAKVDFESKIVLLVDQYEELITRITNKELREEVYNRIFQLLEDEKNETAGYTLKIILTVRADFEPQFRICKPLDVYWTQGKYIVPPFTKEEIREVIEEPAYRAGLEFSPPSLVEEIAEEVYSSQATGLLPLMSFTLNALYDKYHSRGREDFFLSKEDYDELGGVIGGLQNKAQKIYDGFEKNHSGEKVLYQEMMQHIILRMIYLSTGELAGQRVRKDDIEYPTTTSNVIKDKVITELLNSKLILAGPDVKNPSYYEPAHDVLVKSWGQIWDWIGQIGKENLFLRSRLIQAVDDYHKSNDEKLLWDNNPWLDNLIAETQTKEGWLNKKELDFVIKSDEVRKAALEQIKKAEEEKINLIKEKLAEEQEKNKIIEERNHAIKINKLQEEKLEHEKRLKKAEEEKVILINEKYAEEQEKNKVIEERNRIQEDKLKREKRLQIIISAALVLAALLGVVAFYQKRKAVDSLVEVETSKVKIDSLNAYLTTQNNDLVLRTKDLSEAQVKLENQRDSIAELLTIAAESEARAKKEAESANAQRLIAISSAKKLEVEVAQRINAEKLANRRGDSLAAQQKKISRQNEELANLNKQLNIKNDSIVTTKQRQSITQLLNFSKLLEQTDAVKAFRLAELAYKMDSTKQNVEVSLQYSKLANKFGYYYSSPSFNGSYSSYSSDGKYVLVTSASAVYLIKKDSSYWQSDILKIDGDLLFTSFSPKSDWVTLTYKNKIEIYTIDSNGKLNTPTVIREKADVVLAKYNSDGNMLLILTQNELKGYTFSNNNYSEIKILIEKNSPAIANASFSDDRTKLLYNYTNGIVKLLDLKSGKNIKLNEPNAIVNSYISPYGNYFISNTIDGLYLYNSTGNLQNLTSMQKEYGQLIGVIFANDKKGALLTFLSNYSGTKSKEFQQTRGNVENKIILWIDLTNPKSKKKNEQLTDSLTQEDIALLNSNNTAITIQDEYILLGNAQGIIKRIEISTGKTMYLRGHQASVNSISINNGYILTSGEDNTTRIWQEGTPLELDRLKRLPALTKEELERYGGK